MRVGLSWDTCSVEGLYSEILLALRLIIRTVIVLLVFSPHRNEYMCFQKVMKGDYVVPDGFPDQGTDLVKSLLVRS